MGIIEKIKGMLLGDPLWREIVAAYELEPMAGTLGPNQWEGRVGGQRFMLERLRRQNTDWFLTAGEMRGEAEAESIRIDRIEPGVRFEDEYEPENDLNRAPGLQGSELARHYVLLEASPSCDRSILSTAAIKDGLPNLAEMVEYVEFYPAQKSVVLDLQRKNLTRENFDRALLWALSAAKALK